MQSPFTAAMMGFLPLRRGSPASRGASIELTTPVRFISFHSAGLRVSCQRERERPLHHQHPREQVCMDVPWRSAPVQNARPTPVMIPTHSVSSWSSYSRICAISPLVVLSMQLSLSGLLIVTCRMCSPG